MIAETRSESTQERYLSTLLNLAFTALPLTAVAFVRRVGDAWDIRAARGWPAAEIKDFLASENVDRAAASRAITAVTVKGAIGDTPVTSAVYPCIDARGSCVGLLIAASTDDDWHDRKSQSILADLAKIAADDLANGTTVALPDVLDALPEPVVIFDEADRFLHWNKEFEDVYTAEGAKIYQGLSFEEHLRNCLANGLVVAAKGQEEAWLKSRLERFRAANSVTEHQLSNGHWVRVQDRALPGGGRIGLRTDITSLVNGQASLRLLFDANPMPMLIIDQTSLRFRAVNEAAVAFYGYSREDFLTLSLPDIRAEKTEGEIRAVINRFTDPTIADIPRYHVTASGEPRVVKVNACLLDYEGTTAILAAVFDITRQQKIEEELRGARTFLKKIVDHVPTAMFAKDARDGRYVFYNPAAEGVFGRSSATIIGHTTEEIFREADAARLRHQDEQVLHAGTSGVIGDEYIVRPDGGVRCIQIKKVGITDGLSQDYRYILGVAEDVTDQRAREAQITHLANHDTLTGLANRALFLQRLDENLVGNGALFAIHFIDLDGFKAINDTFGHATGDQLLRAVAERMRHAVREGDLVARLGGDEFAVLQSLTRSKAEARSLAGRLVAVLSEPYVLNQHECRISASIGISFSSSGDQTPENLLEKADVALYSAKRSGRNRYVVAKGSLAMAPVASP